MQEVEEEEDWMQLKHEREERAAEVERVLDRVHREAALKRQQQQSGTEYREQDKTRQGRASMSAVEPCELSQGGGGGGEE
eukprot:COSAG06_NODE_953_length_11329_cov_5.438825_14_plen_80_part_00